MESFQFLALLLYFISFTEGQTTTECPDGLGLDLIPSNFDYSQLEQQQSFSLETNPNGATYVAGSDIQVIIRNTISTESESTLREIFIAVQNIDLNEFIGTWATPSSDQMVCLGRPSVLYYSSSTFQSTITFTWRLTDLNTSGRFIIRATITEGQKFWQLASNPFTIANPEVIITCPNPLIFGTLAVWNDNICPGETTFDCNGGMSGMNYDPGPHALLCHCGEPGYSNNCFINFTIEEPINLNCPERTSVNIMQQGSGFVATAELPECTDTSTGADLPVNCNVTALDTFPPGDYGVGCSCTHSSGTETCEYILTFPEPPLVNTPPDITCPGSSTIRGTQGSSGNTEFTWPIFCTDAQDEQVDLTVMCNVSQPAIFQPGESYVGCNCTDTMGGVGQCDFTVTIAEPPSPSNTPPVIFCPASVKEMSVNGSTEVTWSIFCMDTEDEETELTVMCNVSQPAIFQPGESYVGCICTDTMDSVDQCDFNVTITEPPPPINTPPTISCPDDASVNKTILANGNTQVTWSNSCTDTEDEETDLTIMCNVSQPAIFQPGETNVGCNCIDTMGSFDRCDFTVTIAEPQPPINNPPTISCPDPASVNKTILVNGNTEVTWPESCTDAEEEPTELTFMCNVSQPAILQPGENYIRCFCTDTMDSVDQCDFSITITAPNTPPEITCPESSSVYQERLANGDYNVTWANTCNDAEDGPLESVTCNVSQGALQGGETYINCRCTDSMGSFDECGFVVTITSTDSDPRTNPDTPDQTGNCPLPALENTIFSCRGGMNSSQTNGCLVECTDNTVKSIPGFRQITCRNDMWEPRILNKLCQSPIEPMFRTILINVPMDTSSTDCSQPRNLDNGIKEFFNNIFLSELLTSCSSTEIEDNSCVQDSTMNVSSICLTELGARKRRQIQGKAVLDVTLNITSSRDNQFVLTVAENVVTKIKEYRDTPPIDLETTEYTVTLTEENQQAVRKTNVTYNCLIGHAPVEDGYCVLCPPGTYQPYLNSACELCASGTYQNRSGQSNCKMCESNNNDLPGSSECQNSPDQDPATAEVPILFIAIGVAAVLAIFVIILLIVTLCMCCGAKAEVYNETTERGQTAYVVEEVGERELRLEQEAEVALQDYAGRDENDDVNDTIQYSRKSYDSPPATRKIQITEEPATTTEL